MLQSLHIRDFILIKELDLELESGMTAITGETGAGKSILLDAILFGLGGAGNKDSIRPGAEYTTVTLVFSVNAKILSLLCDIVSDISENEIILKRVQHNNGRKKFFINNELVTLKVIQDFARELIDIHAQHSQTKLLDYSNHICLLDEYAAHSNLQQEVRGLFLSYKKLRHELETLEKAKEKITNEIDYLEFAALELENTHLIPMEEEILLDKRKLVSGREKEMKFIDNLINDIASSSVNQIIGKAQRNITRLETKPELDDIGVRMEEIYNIIDEFVSHLKSYLSNISSEDCSLESIDDRLEILRALARKHRCAVDSLPEFLTNSLTRLEELKKSISSFDLISKELDQVQQKYLTKAKELSLLRKEAAEKLEICTIRELSALQMSKARFRVDISLSKEMSINGLDSIRFLASTNPGMEFAPIEKIASGGEISRFMLGLNAAFFESKYEADNILEQNTMIFDEIDVGTSGSVADSIGNRVQKLSKNAQVIVITHQPQVAAKAHHHIVIKKEQTENDTIVDVKKLNAEERLQELARMISGQKITDASLQAAKEF